MGRAVSAPLDRCLALAAAQPIPEGTSERDRDILWAVISRHETGRSMKAIGAEYGIGQQTVRGIAVVIMERMGIHGLAWYEADYRQPVVAPGRPRQFDEKALAAEAERQRAERRRISEAHLGFPVWTTEGWCHLCYTDGEMTRDSGHALRCVDREACEKRAQIIADPPIIWRVPTPDDEERLKRRLYAEWVGRHRAVIAAAAREAMTRT